MVELHEQSRSRHYLSIKTELINYYGITIVNPKHCPDTKLNSQKLVEWLISSAGKTL